MMVGPRSGPSPRLRCSVPVQSLSHFPGLRKEEGGSGEIKPQTQLSKENV